MTTKKSALWLVLVMSILLAFSTSAVAAVATAKPNITTSSLVTGVHGGSYYQLIEATGITNQSGDAVNMTISNTVKSDLNGFGLSVSNTSSGFIELSADKLLNPTASSGYKFTVTAENQYTTDNGDTFTAGVATKNFTLKITAIDAEIVSPDDTVELGFYTVGQSVDQAFTTNEASPTVTVTATGLPTGLTLSDVTQTSTNGLPAAATFKISGQPSAAGTYKTKITVANKDSKITSKKYVRNYTINVLATPGIKETSLSDATYGKKYTQKLTVTGVTKEVPLTSTDVSGLPDGLEATFDEAKGVITITGTPLSGDFVDGVATKTLNIKLKSPAFTAVTEVSRDLKIKAVKPEFTKETKTNAASAAASTNMTKTAITPFDLVAYGPGTITWTFEGLPAGITESSPDVGTSDEYGTTSTVHITGTPTETAKNKTVTATAKNDVGSTRFTFKFNIDGSTPEITKTEPDITKEDNTYAKMQVNSTDVSITLTADMPVTWTAKNLPAGLTIKASADSGTTSTMATITGKPTSPTKSGNEVIITATDPNTKRAAELKTTYLAAYAAPTIKTTKLEVKLGETYKDGQLKLEGESVSTWTVTGLPGDLEMTNDNKSTGYITGQVDYPTDTGKSDGTPVASVTLTVTASGPVGDDATKEVTLTYKGDKPKFGSTTLSDYAKGTPSDNTIKITGTKPIDVIAYITAKDAKAAGITLAEGETQLTLGETADESTGLSFKSEDSDDGVTLTLASDADKGGAYKNLAITISADNGLGSVKKVVKATMTGEAPTWKIGDEEQKDNATVTYTFGTDKFGADDDDTADLKSISVEGDGPMIITASPSGENTASGLNIEVDSEKQTVSITALESGAVGKTTKVTLTAKNGSGTAKLILNLIGQEPPVIADDYTVEKVVEQGKKLSLTLAAKSGTKPITWYIGDEPSEENLVDLTDSGLPGLVLNQEKGTISGTPTEPTTDEEGYAPVELTLKASNAGGKAENTATVSIGVTGKKPKATTKTITLTRGLEAEEPLVADPDSATWSLADAEKELGDFIPGLELDTENGVIKGTPEEAVKNKSVSFILDNVGNTQTAAIKFTVNDPTPVAEPTAIEIKFIVETDDDDKIEGSLKEDYEVAITEDSAATGTSKINWKLSSLNSEAKKVLTLAVTPDTTDDNTNAAIVTATVTKGKVLKNTLTTMCLLTATNSNSKESVSIPVTVTVTTESGALPEDATIGETEVLDEDIVTDEELTAELGEGEVTLGEERTVGMISDAQAQVLADGGYIIAAILPEISATADGQYGFEVDLVESVPEGAELYWFAFPNDAGSEDDEIIDFFDISGGDTEVVPNDHIVVAYPWLRNGVTYAPVIAIKADDAEGAKDSVEDAEEGDVVTEDALEAAE